MGPSSSDRQHYDNVLGGVVIESKVWRHLHEAKFVDEIRDDAQEKFVG